MPPARKRASALGSSFSTEPPAFVIAKLGRPHGLDGFLGVYVDDDDTVSLQPGAPVQVAGQTLLVRALRRTDRGFHIAFEGIHDRDGAEPLRGLDVAVAERRPLGEDEYWPEDLIGLPVFDRDGGPIGTVADVLVGPGQDRIVVTQKDASRFEVPFVDELVPLVDLVAGRIEIVPIPGLIEPSD